MIRIGCSSAFWGDTPAATHQLVHMGGHLDYIVSDYLAEITMCILARSKGRGAVSKGMGDGGYVREFVDLVWKPLMKTILDRKIKLVTNAGGMNPVALKEAIETVAKEAGLPIPIVAAVTGDDLLESAQSLRSSNQFKPFSIEGEEDALWPASQKIMSCNAYLGAFPIAEALHNGAQIVVTGRCADSALVLGPLIHEFGWKADQYDLLSSGSLAGHLIECGCQATGGNFTDWEKSVARGWENVGFPIVECHKDGSFVLTKPENTGGLVSPFTVGEQLLYEIGDPANYILPDVICDWRNVTITEEQGSKKDRVLVTGAKGKPPTEYYKVSVTSFDAFRITGMLMIGGIDAAKKAHAVGNAIINRTRRMLKMRGMDDFIETNVEVIGAEHTYGPHSRTQHTREVMLRIAAIHKDQKALSLLAIEVAPSATSMAPGISGDASGRPHPTPVIRFFSCLIPKSLVTVNLLLKDQRISHSIPVLKTYSDLSLRNDSLNKYTTAVSVSTDQKMTNVPLIELAVGRSGDKGDICNIGVMARRPEYVPYIRQALSEEAVKQYMGHLVKGKVTRYELPGINGFNFVLTKALGGGGVQSLRIDRQGKAYAQMLLSSNVSVPVSMVANRSKL